MCHRFMLVTSIAPWIDCNGSRLQNLRNAHIWIKIVILLIWQSQLQELVYAKTVWKADH